MWSLPKGFRFAGVHCGIKQDANRPDLALVVTDIPASAVGVFTTNQVSAAPVAACKRRLPARGIRGIVINSGNANACTGPRGGADAERMAAMLAGRLACGNDDVLVASTGIIGRPLPMENIEAGIAGAWDQLDSGEEAFEQAAYAIWTTDTISKMSTRVVPLSAGSVSIAGFAKGAAMIAPNMATMLAFLLTDARCEPDWLQSTLLAAVDQSFNAISVDGHMSTNDTVLLLANGAAGVAAKTDEDRASLAEAIAGIARDLAIAIVGDGEGANHLVTIDVLGTATLDDAKRIAHAVANSPLVKTAIYGNDPNWGRICSAAGYAGVPFVESDLSLRLNGTILYDRGVPTEFDAAVESARLRESRETHIELLFTLGNERFRFWTCDLTEEYVHLNADYTT